MYAGFAGAKTCRNNSTAVFRFKRYLSEIAIVLPPNESFRLLSNGFGSYSLINHYQDIIQNVQFTSKILLKSNAQKHYSTY